MPAQPTNVRVPEEGALRAVVRSGVAAPGGGRFDRFDVTSQPVAAPVNAHGQVAFYATVLRAPAREGIFLAKGGHVTKVAAFGDSLAGGGTLAEFGAHPLPSLNSGGMWRSARRSLADVQRREFSSLARKGCGRSRLPATTLQAYLAGSWSGSTRRR